MLIDPFEFARTAQEASGTLLLSALRRVDVLERSAGLDWNLIGSLDERHRPFLELGVQGSVVLECQRCLTPVRVPVDILARFFVAADEAEADAVPVEEDAYDVIVGRRDFDVGELVEDEVILALPIVPKHDVCPVPLSPAGSDAGDAAPRSPFSVLSKLRRGKGV